MATRQRERSDAPLSASPMPRQTSRTVHWFEFARLARWLDLQSETIEDDCPGAAGETPDAECVSPQADVWRSDGGAAEIEYRISRIAKFLGDSSLQDDFTRLALNDETGGQ